MTVEGSKSARRHFLPETPGDFKIRRGPRLSENFKMRIKRSKDQNGRRERKKKGIVLRPDLPKFQISTDDLWA